MKNLNAIFGIPFGSTKEQVLESLKERYHQYFPTMNPSPNSIVVNYIEVAGKKADCIIFNFYNDKLCSSEIEFNPEFEDKIIEEYLNLKTDLSTKYYLSENDFYEFEPPFYPTNELDEILSALKKGKLNIECWWNFKSNTELDDYIVLKITSKEKISLKYIQTELNKMYINTLRLNDL